MGAADLLGFGIGLLYAFCKQSGHQRLLCTVLVLNRCSVSNL